MVVRGGSNVRDKLLKLSLFSLNWSEKALNFYCTIDSGEKWDVILVYMQGSPQGFDQKKIVLDLHSLLNKDTIPNHLSLVYAFYIKDLCQYTIQE